MILFYVRKRIISLLAVLITAAYVTGWIAVPAGLAQIPGNVRIGIIAANNTSAYKNAGAITFSVQGAYQLIDTTALPGMDVIGTPVAGESWQILYLTTGIQVMKNGEAQKVTSGPVLLREVAHGPGNLVVLNSYTPNSGVEQAINKKYRGQMEFRLAAGSVVAVNELPLEEYLYGVVTKEMGKGWPLEALKAQAIIARSYAAANINKHIKEGFNLCDGVHCQAYGGFSIEAPDGLAAVDGTKGQVLTLPGENKPLSAVYHSSSGGHTENNENVWNGKPVSYLRGKPDAYSLKWGPANWTYTTTIDDVSAKLNKFDASFTKVADIKLEKYDSGRVQRVMATDINGYTVTRTGSEFGKLFNPTFTPVKDAENKYISFISNFFDIDQGAATVPEINVLNGAGQKSVLKELSGLVAVAVDRTIGTLNGESSTYYVQDANGLLTAPKYPTGFITFNGHGWGHGVGLSQWGAYQMAKEGKSYREILTFYYTGVEIVSY